VGELFFEGEKVLGDGVNVASRVQSLGQPNTILFSRDIYDKIKNQQEFSCVPLGKFDFKNVEEPMEVFALSNSGLAVPQREKMEGKLKEIKKKSERKKWILAGGILAALIIGLIVYKAVSNKDFTGEKSIAVLPFEDVSIDRSEEYISDGITQGIINNLSKLSSLQKVIAWFSVRRFKNTKQSVKEIADELGVAAILTGTIERQAENIRIVTELVDASSNKRLWGEDYNYSARDILSIQNNLATNIVNALSVKITSQDKINLSKHYTENPEAYKLYRKGRFFWDQRTRESYDSAENYYKRAIDLDPDYALAYSGLADCYSLPFKGLPQLEGIPIARTYAMKALSLDSTLGEALTTLGFIQSAFDYDWVTSKKTLEKAIGLNPNYPTAHVYYGNLLQYTKENTEAGINEIKKALDLDPLSASFNWVLGRNYCFAHKYDLAYTQLKKATTLFPNYLPNILTFVYILVQRKKYSEAIKLCSQHRGDWEDLMLTYALAASGDTISAKKELNKALNKYPDISLYYLAQAYVSLKEYSNALSTLEKAYAVREIDMYFLNVDPAFDPIRDQPGFRTLMKKMNFQ
jgi:TolB-like protein/Tfp pilus assembly protein PilF